MEFPRKPAVLAQHISPLTLIPWILTTISLCGPHFESHFLTPKKPLSFSFPPPNHQTLRKPPKRDRISPTRTGVFCRLSVWWCVSDSPACGGQTKQIPRNPPRLPAGFLTATFAFLCCSTPLISSADQRGIRLLLHTTNSGIERLISIPFLIPCDFRNTHFTMALSNL